jgi:hypothetical protein
MRGTSVQAISWCCQSGSVVRSGLIAVEVSPRSFDSTQQVLAADVDRRFAGEPENKGPAADAEAWAEEHYARPVLFAELFFAFVDFASALMAKNLQEWSKQQSPGDR